MEKISQSTKILKAIYKCHNKISAKEISEITKLPLNKISARANVMRSWGWIKKESLNGHWSYFWINPKYRKYIRKRLINKGVEIEDDETDTED